MEGVAGVARAVHLYCVTTTSSHRIKAGAWCVAHICGYFILAYAFDYRDGRCTHLTKITPEELTSVHAW